MKILIMVIANGRVPVLILVYFPQTVAAVLFLEIKKTACILQTVLNNNGISCVTFYLKQSLRIPEGKHIKGSWRRQRRGR